MKAANELHFEQQRSLELDTQLKEALEANQSLQQEIKQIRSNIEEQRDELWEKF